MVPPVGERRVAIRRTVSLGPDVWMVLDCSPCDFSSFLHFSSLFGADLTGAKHLTAEQVRSATNWHEADLPDSLDSLKDLPD